MEDVKMKLAALWLIEEGALLAFSLLWIMEPGMIDQLMAEVVEGMAVPDMLITLAIGFLIPLAMALLSMTLKNPSNRWANIIVAIVFIVLGIITGHYTYAHSIIISLFEFVVLALIIWYAWKWPKQGE